MLQDRGTLLKEEGDVVRLVEGSCRRQERKLEVDRETKEDMGKKEKRRGERRERDGDC